MSYQQPNNPIVTGHGQKAVILPLILFLIIATSSFFIYFTLKEKELSFVHSMASEEANKIELLLDAQIKEKLLALQRMAQRWEVAEGTPLKVWQRDAANYTGQLSGLKTIEWVDSTYHVRWAEPIKGNEKAIGLDIRFDEKRAQALKGAADRDTPTMTPPLELVQGYRALITYLPLKANGKFDGFMVGIFSIQDFFGGITTQAIGKNYVFSMTYEGQEYFNNGITSTLENKDWVLEKPIQIYDQQWNLAIKPTERFVASQQTSLPITVLIAGLIIALLSAVASHSVERIRDNSMKLLESEERHDLAVRGMSVGLWDWKVATGEMYWSEKLNQIFGITEPNFTPTLDYFSEHLHPDDKEATLKMLNAHLARQGIYNAEYRLRRPDGEYVWINAAGQAQWDEQGKPVRMVGSVVDIGQRMAALSALNESINLKKAVLAGAHHMVIATDTKGIVTIFNKASEIALGYKAEEIIGKHTPAIWHDENEIVARAKILSAELGEEVEPGFDVFIRKAQKDGSESSEWTFIRKDGSRFPVNLTATTLRDERQEITGYLGIIEDITQHNEHERMKRDFISMVVHELRTPLTAIQGSLGLVKIMNKDLSEKSANLLSIATKNSDRLILLINDMLDIDKIAAGQMQFNIEEKTLAPLIRQGIEVNQPYADKFGVSIIAAPISETLKVKVDSARLFQIFANLLSNAAKYSKQGDMIEITTAPFGAYVRILIRDHGTGIPEEFRTRIFGKFTQAASTPTEQPKGGTGLGLHICKQIVEQMGGSIGFDTEMSKGTTFWFELPVA